MDIKITINDISELEAAAQQFIKHIDNHKVFALYGEMGVGKTTFVKAVCQAMGVEENITSPTFAIVNEYKSGSGEPIFHFDFYRIENLEEAYDFGYEDYFYSGNICLIEWPELIEPLLPEDCVKIRITEHDNGSRVIESIQAMQHHNT